MSKPLSPALVRQWHPTLNGVLRWQEISANSSMKIWWQCEKGHAWASSARNRTRGAGCPFCSGHRAWPGENDLQTLFPAIARQWHPTRNAPLTPDQIHAYSGKKIWWRCEKGHSWCTTPASRCSGTGCPYCSGRRVSAHNSLAAKNPQLAAQWHPQKNQGLCPTDVALHSRKKVWWQCENGHQWQATVSNRANGTGCPCCCGHTAAAGVNDLQTKYADLAAQWDPVKNGGLTPRQVLPGSSRVVWWRCAQGHSWQAPIRSRVKGARCPYCSGRRVTAGKTDLAAVYPHLAEQWDLRENGMLQIQDVSLGSHQKVWWRCKKGHLWQASVRHRVGGTGCPVCCGKSVVQGYNDLASIHPALAAQWHPTRNGALSPGDVSCHSDQIIWWQCAKGHAWRASISHRTCGTGCPVCAGKQVIQGENDLASRYPALAAQWHPQKNGTLLPTQITPGSGKSIWWQCGLGHAFCQTPARRVKGSGCPYCANKAVLPGYNDLASVSPQLAAQWHPDKNGTLTPQQVLADSDKKVWWQYHGYSWQERIRARRQTPETPNAGLARYTSFAEQAIFYYVRRHFFAINRYRKIENREIDIFVPELALGIEHDGPLHNRAHVKRRDLEKEAFLASRGIELIRVKTGKRFGAAQRVVTYPHGNWAMLDRAIEQVLYLLGEAAGKSCAADVNCQRDQCAINRQFWENPHKSALTIQTPEAADYWDRAKNGALDPDYIAYTSKTKVWWKCPLGHRWQASVGAFSAGSRCPYCCGKKVLEGFNDLAFIAPELAAQWHPQFNGALTPKDVTRGAMKKVWWQCQNGHAWQATVRSRIVGCGCPYCSGRLPVAGVNDLATTNPKMARQWHPEKNGMLTPSQVSRGSGRPVWWRCAQGHQWRCPPGQRQTDACPFCSGRKIIRGINDLAACRPDLMRQWHEEKNAGLDPGRIGLHSNKKAWWRCEKGHQWQAVISSRVSGCGCPFCSGRRALSGFNDLASAAPALAAQWHPDRNGALTPQNVTRGSGKKVWWRCAQGHEWQAVVAKRSAGQGCPICARAPRDR